MEDILFDSKYRNGVWNARGNVDGFACSGLRSCDFDELIKISRVPVRPIRESKKSELNKGCRITSVSSLAKYLLQLQDLRESLLQTE